MSPQDEWTPGFRGWVMCQIESGTGYWMHPQLNQELETGTVLLLASEASGSIRASQVGGGLTLYFFKVEPARLTGLITLGEQVFFETGAYKEIATLKILPPQSLVATRMKGLCAQRNQNGCLFRLQLLQLFFEVFGNELKPGLSRPEAAADAKERLREFLSQTPAADLLHLNFSELGDRIRCTRRHLTRTFQEVVGMSFRDKQAELRLTRARELLAGSESKVVDVALESGFQSLSLFNLMFKRRFGVSPGRWRTNLQGNKITKVRFATNRKKSACLQTAS